MTMTTNNKTHVFTVTFTITDRELQGYGDAWGKQEGQPAWPDNAKGQFSSMLRADLAGLYGDITIEEKLDQSIGSHCTTHKLHRRL
jgi:hypothetical protein